jgi:hypothetical protein
MLIGKSKLKDYVAIDKKEKVTDPLYYSTSVEVQGIFPSPALKSGTKISNQQGYDRDDEKNNNRTMDGLNQPESEIKTCNVPHLT